MKKTSIKRWITRCFGIIFILSMALSAAKLTKPIILNNEFCPEKIYRSFLKDFEALGGKYEII